MKDGNNFVKELCRLGTQTIRDINKIVDSSNHKNYIDSVSRNHDFKTTIATGNVFPYDNSSELPKRHLKQVTNPEDSFLKLGSLHLI